jgi:carbonic anhydrase
VSRKYDGLGQFSGGEELVMTSTDELLGNNSSYVAELNNGHLPIPPAKKVAVLACMDARLDPAKALGLNEGDAHVIRNACGVAEDDVKQTAARIKANPFVPNKNIRAFVYEVETGKLREVSLSGRR